MGQFVAHLEPPGNLVCDLDGVVYRGSQAIDGVGAALHELDRQGVRLIFATNNSTRTPEQVASKISNVTGYQAAADQVVTSAQAAASMLGEKPIAVYVVGGEGLRRAVADAGHEVTDDWHGAGAVAAGLDAEVSYARIRDAALAVRAGARFIASNTDPTLAVPEGLWPGAGAIIAAITTAAEAEPEIAGKPHGPMRSLIKQHLGPGAVWVIGDRPDTDLALVGDEPWIGVLALTGVTEHGVGVEPAPDLIVASLPELVTRLAASG